MRDSRFEKLIQTYLVYLAERSRDVFWIRNKDYSEQVYISPVFEKVWGRSAKEMFDNPERWGDYLHPEDRARMAEKIKLRNPEVSPDDLFVENYRIIKPDGSIVYIKDQSFPVFDNDELIGFAGIAQDITEERERQLALEAANAAKSEFIANISHDIRTPITGMLGLIDSLIAAADNESSREDANLLKGSTKELLVLLNDVIDVVRLESGHFEPKDENFSLRNLLEHNLKLLKPAAKGKGIELKLDVDADVPDSLNGKQYYLDRILLNLLGNASKFTEKGHIKLSVRLLEKNNDLIRLKFMVEDTGIGIPPEKLDVIFDRFTRLSSSYQGIYKGSGLGLYSVKEYIKAVNGKLNVESKEGKGSTFSVEMTFKPAIGEITNPVNNDTTADKAVNEKLTTRLTTKKQVPKADFEVENPIATVLVVEDHPIAARSARQLLQTHQCASDHAATGEDAVKMAQEKEYYLVLMDIGLPGINGIEATRQIRQSIDAETMPIVALTGHIELDKKQQCLEAGMQDVFNKPLERASFNSILGKYVFPSDDEANLKNDAQRIKDAEISPEDLSTIDLQEGARLAGGKLESGKEMLAILVKSLKQDMEEIKEATKSGNMKGLYDLIHRLYGGLCYCGTPRLRLISKRLKESLLKKDYAEISAQVDSLTLEADNVMKESATIR